MTDRNDKRARFAEQPKVSRPRRAVIAGVCAVLLAASGTGYYLASRGDADAETVGVAESVEASQPTRLNATLVTATAEGGSLSISMADLKKDGFVQFSYPRATGEVPLLAYVSKAGSITTAVRLCEPCNSKSFHIEGDELVCNTCGTRWKTEDLSGISGGCLTYPPQKLTASEQAGRLVIPEAQLASWKPRV